MLKISIHRSFNLPFTMKKLCISALIILLIVVKIVTSEYSTEDCKSLGFSKVRLLCSTCNIFKEKKLNIIFDTCTECCVKDDYNPNLKRYPRAALEVCTCKYGAYPQIQAFIKSNLPKKYKNLQIRHVRGLDPIIKLYDDENKVEDILDIHKWDTDVVDEFLDTHLLKN